MSNIRGDRLLKIAAAPNEESKNGWGLFTTDLVVQRLNTNFEYRRRITGYTREQLKAQILQYIEDEKLVRNQLTSMIVVRYESTRTENWVTDDLWKVVSSRRRLRAIAEAAKKKQDGCCWTPDGAIA